MKTPASLQIAMVAFFITICMAIGNTNAQPITPTIDGPTVIHTGNATTVGEPSQFTFTVNPIALAGNLETQVTATNVGPWILPSATVTDPNGNTQTVLPQLVYHSEDFSSVTLSFPQTFVQPPLFLRLKLPNVTNPLIKELGFRNMANWWTLYTGGFIPGPTCSGGSITTVTGYNYQGYSNIVSTNLGITANIDYNTTTPFFLNLLGEYKYSFVTNLAESDYILATHIINGSNSQLKITPRFVGSIPQCPKNKTLDVLLVAENICGSRFRKFIRLNPINVPNGARAGVEGFTENNPKLICTPNPSLSSVILSISDHSPIISAKIIDNNGRVIKKLINIDNPEIDLSSLPSGTYHVKVTTEKSTFSTNIIRQ